MDLEEFERVFKERPHVVLLGAGASVAAIPNGDKFGNKTSVMDGFLDKLGMLELIDSLRLNTTSRNLEDIYSEMAERPDCDEARTELENRIHKHFSDFTIPDEPTIYDFLILSLRKKDLIATFNWDPLLLQAYQRASEITSELPDLAFLHGNVLVGYCQEHKRGGLLNRPCPACGKSFEPSRLLYPIKQKNYNSDPFTIDNWNALRNKLKKAYLVTIFGYSAPKTDIEAIELMQDAWGTNLNRNLEDFEFIDIRTEDDLVQTWDSFIHTHHYEVHRSYFDSSLGRYPRRSTEELFDRTQGCVFNEAKLPFSQNMSFFELASAVNNLRKEEKAHIGKSIRFENGM